MEEIQQTINSREVARMVEKDHNTVMRDIRRIIEQLGEYKNVQSYFIESTYINQQNKEQPCYDLTKKGCELYSTRMTGAKGTQFAVAYIERFNKMEGKFKQEQLSASSLELALRAALEHEEKMKIFDDRLIELEENKTISPGEYNFLSKRVNQRVSEIAMSFPLLTSKQRGELYRDINNGIKAITGVMTRAQLREKNLQQVLDFINVWEPSTATKTLIKQMVLDI